MNFPDLNFVNHKSHNLPSGQIPNTGQFENSRPESRVEEQLHFAGRELRTNLEGIDGMDAYMGQDISNKHREAVKVTGNESREFYGPGGGVLQLVIHDLGHWYKSYQRQALQSRGSVKNPNSSSSEISTSESHSMKSRYNSRSLLKW